MLARGGRHLLGNKAVILHDAINDTTTDQPNMINTLVFNVLVTYASHCWTATPELAITLQINSRPLVSSERFCLCFNKTPCYEAHSMMGDHVTDLPLGGICCSVSYRQMAIAKTKYLSTTRPLDKGDIVKYTFEAS